IFWSIPVLVAVSMITFLLMHLIPGGPWVCVFTPPHVPPSEVLNSFIQQYGLDQPLHVQYINYIGQVLQGNLGPSFCGTRTVNRVIADGFPISAAFGVGALILGVLFGIPFGVVLAQRRNTWLDHAGTVLITIIVAAPSFVFSIFLLLTFADNLHWVLIRFDSERWQSWILPP